MQKFPVSLIVSSLALLFAVPASAQNDEEGQGVDEGGVLKYTYELRNQKHKDLVLYLRYPSAGKEKVSGLLLICKYGDRDIEYDLTGGSQHLGYLMEFADENKLAVVAFGQPSSGSWNRTVSSDRLSIRDASKQDQNLDALSREWAKIMQRFVREHQLPRDNWLMYGLCGGAQYAHRIALRQPEYFKAVHVHYGGSYDVPTNEAKDVLWLVTSFSDEPAYIAAQRFYRLSREKNYKMIFKGFNRSQRVDEFAVANDYTGIVNSKQRLSLEFFKYALKSDQGNEGESGGYIADFVNGMVLPADKGSWIPKSQAIYLPTREIAEAWGKVSN